MLFWILAGLAVYLINIYLPAALYLPREGLMTHLGSRDKTPEANAITGRARRALKNLQENMPFFLTLALLAFVVPGVDVAQAQLGAEVFVIARAVYIVMYMISIPGLRSVAYGVGLVGNIIQLMALI